MVNLRHKYFFHNVSLKEDVDKTALYRNNEETKGLDLYLI